MHLAVHQDSCETASIRAGRS